MANNKLTVKQKLFVEAMANPQTKTQTEAAVKAGCPPKNARITASRWLTKANILEAIEKRKEKALAHAEVTPEEVIGFAAFQMRSSIDDVLDSSGSFDIEKARANGAIDVVKKFRDITKTITNSEGNLVTMKTTEIEMMSGQEGWKELGKYLGLSKK